MGGSDTRLLILPFNLAVDMPSELDDASPFVWKELELYLRAHGKELKTVSLVDAKRLWISSIQEVKDGAGTGYDDAARVLAQKLAQHAEFDVLIAPSLVVRNAHVLGGAALWDGVERPIQIEEPAGATSDAREDAPLSRTVPAASLHVVVLRKTGEKIQETVGGLEVLVRVRVQREAGVPASDASYELAPRVDLMANPAHLRDGIAVALAPFLPPLRPETDKMDDAP
jgi:hypothetical protein